MKWPKKETWIGIAVLLLILFGMIESCRGRLSSQPAEKGTTPPAEAPSAVPTASSEPIVNELIATMVNKNGEVAKSAAMRLIDRGAVEALVSLYSTGKPADQTRVLWCLHRMQEPVRVFFARVRKSPGEWSPEFVRTVDVLTDLLNDNSFPSMVPVATPPAPTNVIQVTPVPVATPPEEASLAEKIVLLAQLEGELRKYRSSRAKMRPEIIEAARNAHLTWFKPGYYHWNLWNRQAQSMAIRQQYAGECLRLKAELEEIEEIISFLSQEAESLRGEIENLSTTTM